MNFGADSEYGRLRDVLVCRPDHFRWLPTSSISKATLASGAVFDHDLALRQHAELVSAFEGGDVTVHFLEPDPNLPYQVYTRDSSLMTPRAVRNSRPGWIGGSSNHLNSAICPSRTWMWASWTLAVGVLGSRAPQSKTWMGFWERNSWQPIAG